LCYLNLFKQNSKCKSGGRGPPEKVWVLDPCGPPVPPSLVVTVTDLMFKKIFALWWFDKLYVEMDLMWLWR